MSNITTTIEQSKHLLELGLDSKSADMCWVKDYIGQWVLITDTQINIRSRFEEMYEYSGFKWQEHIELVPAWSLSALLEVMPNNDYWEICLWQYKCQRWQCVFDDVEFSNGETKAFVADAPIDAAYEMVCWLLTNNLITNY